MSDNNTIPVGSDATGAPLWSDYPHSWVAEIVEVVVEP